MRSFKEAVHGMATTRRHADLSAGISADLIAKHRNMMYGKKPTMQGLGDFALVFFGNPSDPVQFIRLVDLSEIGNLSEFAETINDLEYVQPDYMLFHKNPFLYNRRQTKVAGQPDLIVEIWSSSDTQDKREFKQLLYSSSPVTEHWYITQNSNTVSCFYGAWPLPDQNLEDILKTKSGVALDLRHLALESASL